jgi:hypothetical protein
MKVLLVVLSSFLFSSLLHARASDPGFDRGNGGNYLLCYTKKGPTYEVLDLYELEHGQFFTSWKDLKESDTFNEIIYKVINRVETYFPDDAQKYRYYYGRFFSDTLFVGENELGKVNDYGSVELPQSCFLHQMAIQHKSYLTDGTKVEKFYLINSDVWPRLNDLNKAAIILHEIVYRTYLEKYNKKPDSYFARRYVTAYLSQEFETIFSTEENPKDELISLQDIQ